MSITTTAFGNEKAPCGKRVAGERFRDRDDECLLTDKLLYACGCSVIRHEYHDGTYSRKVVRHDGKVLIDRMNSEHCARP